MTATRLQAAGDGAGRGGGQLGRRPHHHPVDPGAHAAIRTPSPSRASRPTDIATWDLHATATPGDYREVETLRGVLPDSVLVTARKGTFGHGMSAGGGWELTAQYLGYERGRLYPTPLHREELNRQIAGAPRRSTCSTKPCAAPPRAGGQALMGIGGINACVISRPWE